MKTSVRIAFVFLAAAGAAMAIRLLRPAGVGGTDRQHAMQVAQHSANRNGDQPPLPLPSRAIESSPASSPVPSPAPAKLNQASESPASLVQGLNVGEMQTLSNADAKDSQVATVDPTIIPASFDYAPGDGDDSMAGRLRFWKDYASLRTEEMRDPASAYAKNAFQKLAEMRRQRLTAEGVATKPGS